jgi:hypothetical protein
VGWGRFRPVDAVTAEPVGEAMPWEREEYLKLFPALRVVLLRAEESTDGNRAQMWTALPYNAGDARQRFGFSGVEPLPVYLCDPFAGVGQFERVIARVDGGTLWFDALDVTADPTHAEWLREAASADEPPDKYLSGLAGSERLTLLFSFMRKLEAQHAAEMRELAAQNRAEQRRVLQERQRRNTLEGRLRHALAKADAELQHFSVTHDSDGNNPQLIVEWTERGERHRYRSVIASDNALGVVSSGICLSGRDHDFDLTSLVSVMSGDRD